jgi:hypothetical protein
MGTLHEDQYTFLIISLSFLPTIKGVSDKRCGENRNTHFIFNKFIFFLENHAVYEICGKTVYSGAGHRYGACALHAGYLGYKYTLSLCNTYCFSTATTVVGTRQNVALLYISSLVV